MRLLLCIGALGLLAVGVRAQQVGARVPNIVLIMSDDMGHGDLSSYGASDIKTPNIDGLGRDGVKMTDFYSNGTLCSPTRGTRSPIAGYLYRQPLEKSDV